MLKSELLVNSMYLTILFLIFFPIQFNWPNSFMYITEVDIVRYSPLDVNTEYYSAYAFLNYF